MQSPICASLTMSESTLLVVCYCLYTCIFFYFIRLTATIFTDQPAHIYLNALYFINEVSHRDFDLSPNFFGSTVPLIRKLNLIKGSHVTSRDINSTFNFSFTWKRDFMHAYILFLAVSSSCVVAYHCNTFYWHVLHWTKYCKNFIFFYLYINLHVPQFK